MTQKLMAYDDVTQRLVRTDKEPSDIGVLDSSRVGCDTVPSGVSTYTVTYTSPLPDTDYTINASWENTVDATPLFQPITITNKTVNGFTALWNSSLDTANYDLCYNAGTSGFANVSGTETLGNGVSSVVIPLNPVFTNTDYSVVATIANLVDGTPQFQSALVTSKTTSGFTVKWNVPTDSTNYTLEYQVTVYS